MFRKICAGLPAICQLSSLFLIPAVSAQAEVLSLSESRFETHSEAESSGGKNNLLMQKDSSNTTVNQARWRAFLHTVLPIGMGILMSSSNQNYRFLGQIPILYGLFVGPSMGNYYLEDARGGNLGIAYRAGGAALGIALPLLMILGGDWGGTSAIETVGIYGGMLGGAALFVGGTVWHFKRLPNAAGVHSARNNQARVAIPTPIIITLPTVDLKNRAMGVCLTLQY